MDQIYRKPILYLSDFFEKNKGSYYDYLTIVRQTNNIEQWIKFFLSGVIEKAEMGSETFKKIIELRKIYDECTLIRQIVSTFAIMHMWTMKIF